MPWPPDPPQSFTQFITTVFDTPQGWKLIGFGTGIGFVFAVLALSVSVVSFPMLLDRPIDAEAMDVEIEHPVVAPTIDVPIAIQGTKTIGRWVRGLGLTDERLSPSHSWRHRFKALGRQFNLDTSNNSPIWFVSDFIGMDESKMIPCEISRGRSGSLKP
ncbi:MAG: DUF2189 domain-containing protein [Methylocella sp.]